MLQQPDSVRPCQRQLRDRGLRQARHDGRASTAHGSIRAPFDLVPRRQARHAERSL